jgi:hypothetical protein
MSRVERIAADEAHKRVRDGSALLICAYDSDAKFKRFHLEGALSLSEFESKSASVPAEKELIFY